MSDEARASHTEAKHEAPREAYVTPEVRVMTEAEVLSAFQVTAAGTHSWWSM